MPVSRHSFRRVIGDLVNRHNVKNESTNGHLRNNSTRSSQKIDRTSLISNDSLLTSQTYYERLHKCEKDVYKSLSYLDQVLAHNKLEILGNITTSLIENIFDIENILKGIFEHQSESFRTHLLIDTYSLLADLIEWSDKVILSKTNNDDAYRKIAKDLLIAVQICITTSLQTRSDSFQSFLSVNNYVDNFAPTLPLKREKRSVSSSASILSNRSRNTTSPNSYLFLSSQEQSNDECIQSIVDDINHIVENYTRELDDDLCTKSTVLSSSIDYISQPNHLSISACRHNSTNVLYETKYSHGMNCINEENTYLNEKEYRKINTTDDPPPLPPKRQIARAYMSLFDRYDQNEAQSFLRDTCFVSTSQRRFEDLFEQIQDHYPQAQIFSNSEECLKNKDEMMKSLHKKSSKDNISIDRLSIQDPNEKYQNTNDLFLECISHLLVFNMNEDPPLRGGSIDALIIRATSTDKKDFLYQEAFLTTYRTFISPSDLVDKLVQRYAFFAQIETKKKFARCSFSLLIRIIDEIDNELTDDLMKKLSHFVTNLIRQGELQLGKLLRRKSLERYAKLKSNCEQSQQDVVLIQNSISSKRATLLDFHSIVLSEQLTLVDSELFLKIQLSEVLYMSIEKGEEYSPNLAAFTEHFNNISYWVRSRILERNSQRQRENYFEKFLKILKHLRRLNNFNSYLAILSALDCGPLKRLNWSKYIIDAVSEHTGLIDSTGSFKNYREALNGSVGQPCIPYIGLILSDLTFVHIGNSDYLQDDRIINFWKRWQQFTILHKLRYCRKWEYKFVRNDRILYFFNNFDDYMNEEAQWIQSEKIKPRQKANPYG
ncbi:unnamed protein product [Rotaria magnacalcarata]|uniref:Uncharacterized protein n=1 Tax=Rotaria magnacalcarata TaxID=392030 RepID=A0A816W6Q0_9BILA|nr:unnamed protein product [Rotaria magnacalcarata]CAF2132211.1 unnamed protein product [Rotaria magnacalcarata]CAF3750995.1 unnamed protein product [Rotaria magnacalcarata]CAF3840014.1 unnamed protein product [Rotaria magnacalcarata]